MVLERENSYFSEHRDDLLAHHEGQFVLIHGDELIGSYQSYDDAFTAGIQGIGNQPFLIRQVLANEPPAQFPALTLGLISANLS